MIKVLWGVMKMKKLKDDIKVSRDGKKYVVTRTIQEEYEKKELQKLVEDMEKNLKRLDEQIQALIAQKESLKESLDFWKTKLSK